MSEDYVSDDEQLYRRVPNCPGNVKTENGKHRVSSAAFGDRTLKPSVDRAALRGFDPTLTQNEPSDLIAGLITGEIRERAGRALRRHSNQEPQDCGVDVIPDPISRENPSHALVTVFPNLTIDEQSAFKRLKKALARLATWVIAPDPDN